MIEWITHKGKEPPALAQAVIVEGYEEGQYSGYDKEECAQTQMTLGGMIQLLESLDPNTDIDGIGDPHSFRGYYEDLAFSPVDGTVKAGDLLEICKDCMGEVFTGYKGGDFMMGKNTPVWIAYYGQDGERLMDITDCGGVVTEPELSQWLEGEAS